MRWILLLLISLMHLTWNLDPVCTSGGMGSTLDSRIAWSLQGKEGEIWNGESVHARMCVCVCVHMRTHLQMHVCIVIYAHEDVCAYVWVHRYMYMSMYVCTSVHVCAFIVMQVHMYLHRGILLYPFLPMQLQARFWNVYLSSLVSNDLNLQYLTGKQSNKMSE